MALSSSFFFPHLALFEGDNLGPLAGRGQKRRAHLHFDVQEVQQGLLITGQVCWMCV